MILCFFAEIFDKKSENHWKIRVCGDILCGTTRFEKIGHATPWCNGSTTGFGPVSLGSSPGGVAIFFAPDSPFFNADIKKQTAVSRSLLVGKQFEDAYWMML